MYDHNRKAGNQGDVVKHTALIAAVDSLLQEGSGPFRYADTFAGYAYNPLRESGEWRYGIGVIHEKGRLSDDPHVRHWQELWQCDVGLLGSTYPGSSVFVLKQCLRRSRSFRARLWDISPTVVCQLMSSFEPAHVEIIPRSATADDFSGVQTDFLLIDPPGLRTRSRTDYPRLNELLSLFSVVENALLWFPMTAYGTGSPVPQSAPSVHQKEQCLEHGLSVTSVRWSAGAQVCGCRLAYRLRPAASDNLRQAVDAVAMLMGWPPQAVVHE